MKRILTHIFAICIMIMAISCGEDRTWQYEEKTQHNHWIHELMSEHYLWADTVARMELGWKDYFATPSDFLSKLTSKSGLVVVCGSGHADGGQPRERLFQPLQFVWDGFHDDD